MARSGYFLNGLVGVFTLLNNVQVASDVSLN
jgi:hypothetical protein